MNPLSRPVLAACVVFGLIVLVSLGTWQVQRLEWKEGLIATVTERVRRDPVPFSEALSLPADEAAYLPVSLEAQAMDAPLVHVQALDEGKPGWMVFGVVAPATSVAPVIVNHGFVSIDDRAKTYEGLRVGPMTGLLRAGTVSTWLQRAFAPPPNLEEGTFYLRDPETLAAFFVANGVEGVRSDLVIDRTDNQGPLSAETPKGGRTRIAFSNKHFGYALTWYGLALTLIGVYVALLRQRPEGTDHEHREETPDS